MDTTCSSSSFDNIWLLERQLAKISPCSISLDNLCSSLSKRATKSNTNEKDYILPNPIIDRTEKTEIKSSQSSKFFFILKKPNEKLSHTDKGLNYQLPNVIKFKNPFKNNRSISIIEFTKE